MIPPDIERVALLGWHVFPTLRHSRALCFPGAVDAATCDLDAIEGWCRAYPSCGWRVLCGPSGLFALDVDRPGTHSADGFATMRALVAKHGALPPRPMTRSGGSGGAALFFRHQGEPIRGQSGAPGPGLDPHRGRQAVTIPPSVHPATGGAYTWRVAPWDVAPPAIPVWLATLLAPRPEPEMARMPVALTNDRARNTLARAILAVIDAPAGAANVTLNKQAYRLGMWCGAGLIAEADARAELYHAARRRQVPSREAVATIASGLRAGIKRPVQARHG